MRWLFVKELSNIDNLTKFELKYKLNFPISFKEKVMEYNGGRPRPNTFDTIETKERVVKGLLSFNEEDRDNIWSTYENIKDRLPDQLVPILSDPFGNYICFDFDPLLKEPRIIFWDHETSEIEKITKSFPEFIDSLYELEE